MNVGNKFDSLKINIQNLHSQVNSGLGKVSKKKFLLTWWAKLISNRYPELYYALIDSGFERSWFNEFKEYWEKGLGGRPIYLHDFFFLYGNYRVKFQSSAVEQGASTEKFLEAWQLPENVYMTFGTSYRYALSPLEYKRHEKYIGAHKGGKILEYGAGYAPVITSLLKSGFTNYDFTAADIGSFTFHNAKYRLTQHGVKFVDIEPRKAPTLPHQHYDLVFLMTVLEHLPDPVEVINLIATHMNSGAILIFDYILGDGHGLDTIESVEQRSKVLDFIVDNFEIIEGAINYQGSMSKTVARKK
jgi:2-polyprenyl-3-methyl-5-hydroxy-6-metoxy-1,4-benzoquinol methylase